jgi:hypothetical protein
MAYYRIICDGSGLCLDVPGFSREEGLQIQQYFPNRGVNQLWEVEFIQGPPPVDPPPGMAKIRSANSALVLDIRGNSVDDHGVVQQYHENGGENQLWVLESDGFRSFTIGAFNSRGAKVLDVIGASNDPGAKLQTFRAKNSVNQQFRLEVVYF